MHCEGIVSEVPVVGKDVPDHMSVYKREACTVSETIPLAPVSPEDPRWPLPPCPH